MRQSQGEVFTEMSDARPFARFWDRFRHATWEALEIVKRIDEAAFIVIHDVKDVHGRGFQPLET